MAAHPQNDPGYPKIYTDGETVVTRRGKRGRVLRTLDSGMIVVAFSPTHEGFEMKPTAVIRESAYTGMMRGTRPQARF